MVGITPALQTHEDSHTSGGTDEIDSVLGVAAIPSHTAAKHSDRTRRVFIPAQGAFGVAKGHVWGQDLDLAGEKAYGNVVVPKDWVTTLEIYMVVASNGAADIVGDLYKYTVADDEAYTTNPISLLNTTFKATPTSLDLYCLATGITVNDIAADDTVYLEFSLDSGDVHFIGWIFEYTADE